MSKKCPVCKGEIEEMEVPVYEAWINNGKVVSEERAVAAVGGQEVKQYIKLKACKACGLYVRDND